MTLCWYLRGIVFVAFATTAVWAGDAIPNAAWRLAAETSGDWIDEDQVCHIENAEGVVLYFVRCRTCIRAVMGQNNGLRSEHAEMQP